MLLKRLLVAAGFVGAAMCLTAPVALAQSGSLDAGFGTISYNDNGDSYTVCDTRTDDVGVTGRIAVQRADGSWNYFPWRRDGDGNNGNCEGNNVDILRESATVLMQVCLQNTSSGDPYSCNTKTIPGN